MQSFNSINVQRAQRRFRSLTLATPLVAALTALAPTAMAETGTFEAAGVPIHFVDEGEGEAVIFLHGFAGASSMWSALGLMPMDGFRTIAFDARGHGQSGKPTDADAYGEELVNDVIRLMDDRGIAEAHIVGYSMGAETALRLGAEYPDRVLSIVAAGSGWSGDIEAESYSFIGMALASCDTFGGFMADMSPPGEEMTDEMAEAMMGLLAAHGIDPGQSAAPLAGVAESMFEIISLEADELTNISVPVLGIAGENDPERPNVEALSEAFPGMTVVIVPEADHLSAPLAPVFAETIRTFIAE